MTTKIDDELQEWLTNELLHLNWAAARIAVPVALFIIPFSLIWDYLIIPQHFMLFLYGRSLIFLGCLALAVYTFSRKFSRHGDIVSLVLLLLIGVGVTTLIHIIGSAHSYYGMLLLLLVATLIIPWRIRFSIIVSSVLFVAYIVPVFFIDSALIRQPAFISNLGFLFEMSAVVILITILQSNIRNKEILSRLISERQAKELELRERYKAEFLSNITHELKTPLSIVIGNIDIIMEHLGEKKPALMEQARLVQQAAFQLASHVDRIITISTIDDPEVKLDLQNYNFCGIVQNVHSLFVPGAQQAKITYALNCPETPLVVSCDVVRVEEALTNLIQNAFKFTPTGGSITVTVASDGINVVTEVSDTGVGIPEEKQARLFERMFQADDALSKRHGGIGLGLYIVKKSIELQGGSITVHSKEGNGSSFRFVLPLYVDQTVAVKNQPFEGDNRRQIPRRSGADRRADERRRMFEYQQSMGLDDLAKMSFGGNLESYENQSPSRPSILIVEDNPGMMKVIVEVLRQDYNLFLGRDAFEGLDKLKAHDGLVNLILADVMMPGMSGFDFCKQVMENDGWKSIPLIFVTALMSEADQLKGFAIGATDYITKPYNIKILKEKVDHWISRRQYEAILENMSRELEAKVEQVSKVKDIVLHEIRNPLTIITSADSLISMAQQNAAGGFSDKQMDLQHYLTMLRGGVTALQNVMETSRHFDGANMPVRKSEKIEALVNDAIAQSRHLLGSTQLKLDLDNAADIMISADRRMLVQVLVNIIRNACEAIVEKGPAGGGLVTLVCCTYDTSQVAIKITDNGIGMSDEVRDKLFGFKFTTKKDGTGVGLHLSKMLVKLHEGLITVDSKRGSGTTVSIYLPILK